jgi:hypothetical protein
MPPFATPQNTRLSYAVGDDSQGSGNVQPHHSSVPVFSQVLDELSVQDSQARTPACIINQSGVLGPNPGFPLYTMTSNGIPLNAPQVRIPTLPKHQ